MNGLAYESDDESYIEDDEALFDSDDEFVEDDYGEKRKRNGLRRPRRVQPGSVGNGRNLFRPRSAPGDERPVTQAQLKAGLARVGQDIRKNSEAIKRSAAQINSATKTLNDVNAGQDKQIGTVKKDVKKQAEMSLLLTLLQKPPKLEPKTEDVTITQGSTTKTIKVLTADTTLKSENNMLLPLLLTGGLGGGNGGDNNNMLLLALALGGQL
jgi:hypothetical protein